MATYKTNYIGVLRAESTHLQSGTMILTDAPTDNMGKGQAFSPTDLVATAYASCMITIMGIYCENHGVTFDHAEANVLKVMSEDSPRRIVKIVIELDLQDNKWNEHTAHKVIQAGKACPVAKTLGDNVEVEFTFNV